MGCFSYICNHCGQAINEGENCVMIHIRKGQELGRTNGHYDGYGRVIEEENLNENEKFRGNGKGPNSHQEICNSEFNFSSSNRPHKLIDNKPITYEEYALNKVTNDYNNGVQQNETFLNFLKDCPPRYEPYKDDDNIEEILKTMFINYVLITRNDKNLYYKDWISAPDAQPPSPSGIIAHHLKCYAEATKNNCLKMIASKNDPNQGCGEPNNLFI